MPVLNPATSPNGLIAIVNAAIVLALLDAQVENGNLIRGRFRES
jgi:hypothetical protein